MDMGTAMDRKPAASERRRARMVAACVAAAGMFVTAGASAQEVRVDTTLQSRLTYTDNVDTDADNKQGDWIAEVSPGLSIRRDGSRLSGVLNAQLRNLVYARDSERNESFVSLGGRGVFEAVEEKLFIDMDARISRDNRSAFSGRGAGSVVDADKNNETRNFAIGPRLQLKPFGSATAMLGYKHSWMDGGGEIDSRQVGRLTAQLTDFEATSVLGWGLDLQQERSRYDEDSDRDVDRSAVRGMIYFNATPRFRPVIGGGRERNDFGSGSSQDGTIKSAGFEWMPSPATTLNVLVEDRFFGTGYKAELNRRRPRSNWSINALRDVNSPLDEVPGAQAELLYQQYYDALGSIADPVARDAEARRLADQQLANGSFRFQSNNYYVSQTLRGNVSLIGKRSVLTLTLQQTRRNRLGEANLQDSGDDFARFDTVKDRSASLSLAHKLSPQSSGNLVLTRSRAEGSGSESGETDRTAVTVGMSTRINERATGGVQYRYERSDGSGAAKDFTENSVTANIGVQF